ncbi:uncharacterized protein TNCT_18161 [Trichonephila clavata]|uniref:Uncharacterized protein n=1 Tax=Trichonephila clavata TaxID=2740835 RepID=A0A8X6L0E1_TRICU|nr:uncharacterized protein TNCT_18161 [Trichonephila clavata]
MESANEETDAVETKVKLKKVIDLQRKVEELPSSYYAIPNVKEAKLSVIDEELNLLEERLEKLEQVVPELDYLIEPEKKTVVQEREKMPEAESSKETVLLNNDSSTIFDELLELSNNYFKVINILSYIFRFIYNCKSKKVVPLTVAEFKMSEIKLIKHAQRPLFDKKRNSK